MGMVQDHIVLEGKIVIQMMVLTPLRWTVLIQEEWLHLLTTNLALQLMLGICLIRTEICTLLQLLKIFIREKIFFCDYGNKYQLEGELAGKHDTLAGHRPPPKWYR